MSIENKVFEILSTKVELESQKIELALTDDVKSADKKLTASYNEINKIKNTLLDNFKIYKGSITQALNNASVANDLCVQLSKKSKEFGLEIPQEYVNIQKNAQVKHQELDKLFGAVNKSMSIL